MTQNCPEISWLDLAAAETRNEVGSSRDATRRHCSILLRQSQSMTKKKLECYALPLAMYFLLEGMVEEEGDETSLPRTLNGNGICTFVFVYFHVRHPGTSFLRFSYNNLLKNIAYVMVYTLYKVVLPFAKGLFVPHGAIRFFSRIASTMAAYAHQPT